MNLKQYLKKNPFGAQADLASKLGISRTWMTLIVNGHVKPSPKLSIEIENHTGVSRSSLRPDLYLSKAIPKGMSDSAEVIYRRLLDLPNIKMSITPEDIDHDDDELLNIVLEQFFKLKGSIFVLK
jgi:DNA-binding transcriptional regulator YdaS (Cro superfamily)